MKNPFRKFRKWLKQVKKRQGQPPFNRTSLTVDESGFRYGEKQFLWTDITKINIYLVDFFMYDRVEVALFFGSRITAITEGDEGFEAFIERLQIVFPAVVEPLGFLSRNAFSTEVFEIDI